MGRPKKYLSEEERKQAHKPIKTKYMEMFHMFHMFQEWNCSICGNKDYSLAGKWSHLKTKKHIKKEQAANNKKTQ